MAVALDDAAGALLSVWDAARERTTSRLSSAQLRAVMVVEQQDGINLRRLANLLDMLLSSASRLCDRLVAAGMMEREPGRVDRREISLHLTPEAQRLLAELRAERQHRLADVLAGMSPQGQQALLRGLDEFAQVVRRQEHPDRPAGPSPDEPTPAAGEPSGPANGAGPLGAVPPPRAGGPVAGSARTLDSGPIARSA